MRVKLARSMRAGAATAIRRLRVTSHVCPVDQALIAPQTMNPLDKAAQVQ